MSKWADYCIAARRYNSDHTHIVKVRLYPDNGDALGSAQEWTRAQVVEALKRGTTFVTIVKGDNGQWKRGEDVRRVTIGGADYIRTDNNNTAKDNLGNLPDF